MSYVRHLPEVGDPLKRRVDALDDLIREVAMMQWHFDELAARLQQDVDELWSPFEIELARRDATAMQPAHNVTKMMRSES
jgi:hypothetical protein